MSSEKNAENNEAGEGIMNDSASQTVSKVVIDEATGTITLTMSNGESETLVL